MVSLFVEDRSTITSLHFSIWLLPRYTAISWPSRPYIIFQ